MRDPDRVDRITTLLYRYWRKNPDLRLGQIVGNIATKQHRDPYYIEDEDVEEELSELVE